MTIALVTAGNGTRTASASDVDATVDWSGKYLGRRPNEDRLRAKMRSFFGKATGALVPTNERYLNDQFNIGSFDEYRLPDDQVIAVQEDGRLGVETVAVIDDSDSHVLAASFLTNQIASYY